MSARGRKIAIRRRKAEGLLASLYEFVNVEGRLETEGVKELVQEAVSIEPVTDAKHIFSHVEWHMRGYFVTVDAVPLCLNLEGEEPVIFVTWKELKAKYPIPSAFEAYKNYLDRFYRENQEEK